MPTLSRFDQPEDLITLLSRLDILALALGRAQACPEQEADRLSYYTKKLDESRAWALFLEKVIQQKTRSRSQTLAKDVLGQLDQLQEFCAASEQCLNRWGVK